MENCHPDFEKVKETIITCFSSLNILLTGPALRIGISKLDTDNYAAIVNTWVPAHGFEDNKLMTNEKLLMALKNAGLVRVA